jgi:hypothetical protein
MLDDRKMSEGGRQAYTRNKYDHTLLHTRAYTVTNLLRSELPACLLAYYGKRIPSQSMARLSIGDILHRGVVYSLAALSVYGVVMSVLIHRDTMKRGRGV